MTTDLFIADFVPVSLIDYPGEVSSTAFTHGCNLRCRYCHNPELVIGRKGEDRRGDFLFHLKGKDIDGVAVTGGEPLFSPEILPFLRFLKKEGFLVKLDTNGFCPEKLDKAVSEGLIDMAAVDVKAFNDADLKYITRADVSMDTLHRSIGILREGGVETELRHTIWKVPSESDVKIFMDKSQTDKLSVQFLMKKGRWLDKTFTPQLKQGETERARSVFDIYEVKYRNG